MGELVSNIFTSFSETITGLAGGLREAFTQLIYANGTEGAFSPLLQFLLVFAGVSLAAGVLWKIFGLIKGKGNRPM